MWKQAIEDAVEKTRLNIERFGDAYPQCSKNDEYMLLPNANWTNGFWSGILWLCYEYSGDEVFRTAARRTVDSFKERLDQQIKMDTHDIGFLFSLSSKAQWMIDKDPAAKQLTLDAADMLMRRWRSTTGVLQAWGPEGDASNGGRMIIDCLMNLPILYWAYEMTGKQSYLDVATNHANKSRRFLVRGDDSSYHTFYFDQETGEALRGATQQGYTNGSTWTRGQAWGIYGFTLSYKYTKDPLYLETALRMTRFFLDRLPEDKVVYWDFDAPIHADTNRDSSANAIAACGIHEMLKLLPADHDARGWLQKGFDDCMSGLMDPEYSTIQEPEAQGFIKHGSYSVRKGNNPDDFTIWGDYFYLEALMRMERGHKGYWYE
ncbi:glycoside hydrolase family 88 protein [Paenibacillus sp. F411]|uniref:Ugl n=1 Tax=Paenibacillus algicola TaxID=2565926 RepID=A0A4P8XNA0_9BACL|nr:MULTISPECIES: glycoside hydrolase family 88 protein [Paenibacillus]MBO2945597.1 glycoside hydrolase family 88 protein [Paenibacillus sp. F411]QCT04322.1 Ugl [Paenibacillus algicola]